MTNSMTFIGIDPGKGGAIAQLNEAGTQAAICPTLQGKKTKRLYDVATMCVLLKNYCVPGPLFAVIEKTRVMPKEGVSSAHSIGYGAGLWEGMLAALGIPYMVVEPRRWQKEILGDMAGDTKQRSVLMAGRMFPETSLIPERCRVPHTGLADALCLAEYARRIRMGKDDGGERLVGGTSYIEEGLGDKTYARRINEEQPAQGEEGA